MFEMFKMFCAKNSARFRVETSTSLWVKLCMFFCIFVKLCIISLLIVFYLM